MAQKDLNIEDGVHVKIMKMYVSTELAIILRNYCTKVGVQVIGNSIMHLCYNTGPFRCYSENIMHDA